MRYPPGEIISRHLTGLARAAELAADSIAGPAGEIAEHTFEALAAGRKLMFCGNGGSAADAQHLATEYVVRFRRSGRALAALALTTDTSLLTAASNDFGFEHVFARQVEALGAPGDLLFLHSTSGESPNLLAAAEAARARGVITVGLLARDGGRLLDRVDHAIVVDTESGAHAQELHLAIGHAICDIVEARLRASDGAEAAVGPDAAAARVDRAR